MSHRKHVNVNTQDQDLVYDVVFLLYLKCLVKLFVLAIHLTVTCLVCVQTDDTDVLSADTLTEVTCENTPSANEIDFVSSTAPVQDDFRVAPQVRSPVETSF